MLKKKDSNLRLRLPRSAALPLDYFSGGSEVNRTPGVLFCREQADHPRTPVVTTGIEPAPAP